jgi:hypothetical protein
VERRRTKELRLEREDEAIIKKKEVIKKREEEAIFSKPMDTRTSYF